MRQLTRLCQTWPKRSSVYWGRLCRGVARGPDAGGTRSGTNVDAIVDLLQPTQNSGPLCPTPIPRREDGTQLKRVIRSDQKPRWHSRSPTRTRGSCAIRREPEKCRDPLGGPGRSACLLSRCAAWQNAPALQVPTLARRHPLPGLFSAGSLTWTLGNLNHAQAGRSGVSNLRRVDPRPQCVKNPARK
jgi:hypothetical protein